MDLLHISVAEIAEEIICHEFWRNMLVYLQRLEEGLNAQCIYVNIEYLKKTKSIFRDIFRFSGKTKFGFLPKCKIIRFFKNLI